MMNKCFITLAVFFSFTAMLICCGPLPTKTAYSLSSAPTPDEHTRLAKIFSPGVQGHDEQSGILLIRDGKNALLHRLYLADLAEHTIEAQYYIWNGDKSGKLLMQRLLLAAERGVTVRLLLDDFSIGDRNKQLTILNSHPNIHIRIYNPFVVRSGVAKWLNFAFDFDRLNRRMHNKTFTVDGTTAITGGRNIGDEYFSQNEHLNFNDADLLSIGPVVHQVSESFFNYWNSPWAVPVEQLIGDDATEKNRQGILQELAENDLAGPLQITLPSEQRILERHFQELLGHMVWAPATFIYDEPGSTEKEAYSDEPKRVARHLLDLAGDSRKEVLIESAYFVLNEAALEIVDQVYARGVTIRALTNSMASNDVLPNHASYAMVRKDMLKHGIELYELRPDAESCLEFIGREDYCDNDSAFGLHAKTAVFDREIVYVGSLNMNLRSAYLNSEAAMIVYSPFLAEILAAQIEINMRRENSWQAMIKEGEVQWVTVINGLENVSSHEPQTTWLERVKKGLLILVPGSEYY